MELNSPYFFVIDGVQTRVDMLPLEGRMDLVGEGDRRVGSPVVQVDGATATVHPGDGTAVRINDEPLDGPRVLVSGDTLEVGERILVFHARTGREVVHRDLDQASFRNRLVQEVERAQRTGRPLCLLGIALGEMDADTRTRVRKMLGGIVRLVDVVGWLDDGTAMAILPDTGASGEIPARRIMDLIAPLAPRVAVSMALSPDDGIEADALLAGARLACLSGEPGRVTSLDRGATVRPAGPHVIRCLDPVMRGVLALVEKLAKTPLPVLVTGETGVGKELISRALHEWSGRSEGPFVALNCAAVAETLFESELFGHEKGAFTDASSAKAGLMEMASGGTLLLDEVGEMPERLQVKLLRVLETGRVTRLGAVEERQVDVRIIAATNRDLETAVGEGLFRSDLFYRLAAARVQIPPLTDRPLDIPLLARSFLDQARREAGRPSMGIRGDAMKLLCAYRWPGNARELKNIMLLCGSTVERDELVPEDLPDNLLGALPPWLSGGARDTRETSADGFAPFEERRAESLKDEVALLERTRIRQALRATCGVQVQAAKLLGVPQRTFTSKLRTHAIDPGDFRKPGGDGG